MWSCYVLSDFDMRRRAACDTHRSPQWPLVEGCLLIEAFPLSCPAGCWECGQGPATAAVGIRTNGHLLRGSTACGWAGGCSCNEDVLAFTFVSSPLAVVCFSTHSASADKCGVCTRAAICNLARVRWVCSCECWQLQCLVRRSCRSYICLTRPIHACLQVQTLVPAPWTATHSASQTPHQPIVQVVGSSNDTSRHGAAGCIIHSRSILPCVHHPQAILPCAPYTYALLCGKHWCGQSLSTYTHPLPLHSLHGNRPMLHCCLCLSLLTETADGGAYSHGGRSAARHQQAVA